MTAKQTALYFREWGYVRGYCKRHQLPELDRHALHVQALGMDKSSRAFTNEEFDQVLAVFRAVHQPANVNAQLRQLKEPRTRFAYALEELFKCLALYVGDVDAYVSGICLDMFGTPDWRDLSIEGRSSTSQVRYSSQLDKLRFTLNRCLNGKTGLRNKAHDSLHDMRTKAGLECGCSGCAAQRRPRVQGPRSEPMMAGGPNWEENEPF